VKLNATAKDANSIRILRKLTLFLYISNKQVNNKHRVIIFH